MNEREKHNPMSLFPHYGDYLPIVIIAVAVIVVIAETMIVMLLAVTKTIVSR